MPAFSASGWSKLSALLLELYAPGDLPTFRRRAAQAVHRAFGGEMVCHNEIHVPDGASLSVLARPVDGFDALREAFFLHVADHPSIQHLLRADGGEAGAVKTSDFVSQRQWRNSGLYREFYRELDDIRYQLTIGHRTGDWLVFFAVSRTRGDFTEEERTLLTLLRPHFVQAYENARRYGGGEAPTAGTRRADEAWLRCDREGVIRSATEPALQAIERWFPEPGAGDRLPAPLVRWWRHQWPNGSPAAPAPYRLADARGELEARAFLDLRADAGEILFAERVAGGGIGVLRTDLGLSRREADVLRWAIEGKTNPEIACILGVSLATVKTHMSHILRRLDVETRAAAVRRAMEVAARRPSTARCGGEPPYFHPIGR